jgi:hypothetical protein
MVSTDGPLSMSCREAATGAGEEAEEEESEEEEEEEESEEEEEEEEADARGEATEEDVAGGRILVMRLSERCSLARTERDCSRQRRR